MYHVQMETFCMLTSLCNPSTTRTAADIQIVMQNSWIHRGFIQCSDFTLSPSYRVATVMIGRLCRSFSFTKLMFSKIVNFPGCLTDHWLCLWPVLGRILPLDRHFQLSEILLYWLRHGFLTVFILVLLLCRLWCK